MSTDYVERLSMPSNEIDEPADTLAREWRHAAIAFAVLLAMLVVGTWAMSTRGEQRVSTSVPVIHESF
jgi:hypothetical protein